MANQVLTAVYIIYLIDIFVKLRTTYISNRTGNEIFGPLLIARKYIMSKDFLIDFIASFAILPQFYKLKGLWRFLEFFGLLKLRTVGRLRIVIINSLYSR